MKKLLFILLVPTLSINAFNNWKYDLLDQVTHSLDPLCQVINEAPELTDAQLRSIKIKKLKFWFTELKLLEKQLIRWQKFSSQDNEKEILDPLYHSSLDTIRTLIRKIQRSILRKIRLK